MLKAGSTYCLALKIRNQSKQARQVRVRGSWGERQDVFQLVAPAGQWEPNQDYKVEVQLHAPRPLGGAAEVSMNETLWIEMDGCQPLGIQLSATVLSAHVSGATLRAKSFRARTPDIAFFSSFFATRFPPSFFLFFYLVSRNCRYLKSAA